MLIKYIMCFKISFGGAGAHLIASKKVRHFLHFIDMTKFGLSIETPSERLIFIGQQPIKVF